jgi:protein-S-isoprenylcysteine O-methyltransferase Ste14
MTLSAFWTILNWIWIASEVLILVITRTRRSSGNVHDRGSLLILWPVIVISITIGTWIGESHPPTIFGGAHWIRSLSLALLIAGLAIRWTAIVTLGRSFSANVAIHANQTLHKTGLFRFVRHPSYSGMVILFVAVGLNTRNWIGLAIILIPTTIALLYRIHVEEAALTRAFGQEYLDYSGCTKRLIPGIY